MRKPALVSVLLAAVICLPTREGPAAPGTLARRVYYVERNAASGCSDSFPGSPTRPWCTIGKAAGVLKAGDSVVVRPGIYHEAVSPPSGSPSGHVTYQGQPGAVLDGTGVAGPAFDLFDASFVRISGFEVTRYRNPRPAGNAVSIRGRSHHIELSRLWVHHNWNGIIIQDYAYEISVADSEVHDSAYGVGFENAAHHIRIENVRSHHNSELLVGPPSFAAYPNGDGFSADSGTSDISLKNSSAYDNQDGGFDLASEATSCENCVAHGNRYGFRLWQGDSGALVNCLAFGNTWYPLQVGSNRGSGTKQIYNSTFVGRAGDKGYSVEVGGVARAILRNNIFADYVRGVFSGKLDWCSEDYDLFHSPGRPIGFAAGAHSLAGDPLFVDPTAGDFHLRAASPAIDRGMLLPQVVTDLDRVARPQGAAPDIGAYEYVAAQPRGIGARQP